MIGLIEFRIVLRAVLSTASTDQLFLYNISLIKSCSAYPKQNAAVKTASEVCLL